MCNLAKLQLKKGQVLMPHTDTTLCQTNRPTRRACSNNVRLASLEGLREGLRLAWWEEEPAQKNISVVMEMKLHCINCILIFVVLKHVTIIKIMHATWHIYSGECTYFLVFLCIPSRDSNIAVSSVSSFKLQLFLTSFTIIYLVY
jgi:hypothetical protein